MLPPLSAECGYLRYDFTFLMKYGIILNMDMGQCRLFSSMGKSLQRVVRASVAEADL
jgi:hypothetical protein